MTSKIPFNKPWFSGDEIQYLSEAAHSGQISGNGIFTKKCQTYFVENYHFKKALLTTSCTDALEMASILLNIQPGDEVICPSFAFVSTANAFALRGAHIVFADSEESNPNIDANKLVELITPKTKAIVIIHYAGFACDMDALVELCREKQIFLVEDAAQAIDSFYKGKALGSFGHVAAFSFHETKNISCGEGGLLSINHRDWIKRAEIIWEKGTNRAAFFRGEIDKYTWVDLGSSFLPSELSAAFLFAQLQHLEEIRNKRLQLWNYYNDNLSTLERKGLISRPFIPEYSTNNGHIYYLCCHNNEDQKALIQYLKSKNIQAVFHYLPLHLSTFGKQFPIRTSLQNAIRFSETLVRLPLFFDLKKEEQDYILEQIEMFFLNR